ncbi:MAG: ParB N-terminal domain-containing protein [Desulfobacula sp.]|uniref:ParB/RepB/Spo0J family partition protein n=1 Tax=Desulfobacula sp. TaxID=2593537 RepID=UPI0025B95A78|nr:ParB N-terminal domain-containing protein [Desulfobacula sp.]MCD4723176.1 ParB N-terminal domain-containing protein [Desulfobacula sp.]
MSDLLCKINICDIDLTDERYKISFSQDDITFLANSIRQAGLVAPPVVRPLNNKFIIISGFNRVRALIYNNRIYNNETKILVYKTRPDTPDYSCFIKSIAALAFQRPLTHAELIISIRRLYQFLDKKEIAKKSPGIFNIELNARFVEDLLAIGVLPDPALELIHHGNLSFKSAKRIASYEKETIKIFLKIFSKIKASNNKQLEIIQHIMEISARDTIKPKIFFNNQAIQDILFAENKEPGLKTKELRAWLFEQRFPTIFNTHQMIRQKITSIKFGNNIKFIPPENFESQNYSISFTAKNYSEFVTNVQNLNKAIENKELKEIFNQ